MPKISSFFKQRFYILLPVVIVTLLGLTNESKCQTSISFNLDNCRQEPKLIEDLGSSFGLFNLQEPVNGLNEWGEHWVTGDLIVFSSFRSSTGQIYGSSGSRKYTFVAFSISENQEKFRFDLPGISASPKMVHKLNEQGPLIIIFSDGDIFTYEPKNEKLQKYSTGVEIYTSLRLSSENAIILGASKEKNKEYPCFIKLDYNGRVISTEIKKSFKRQACVNNYDYETIFKYQKKLYWYNVANSTLYVMDNNLKIIDSIILELPNLITYDELLDTSIFEKYRMNKFSGKTHIKGMGLINSTLVLAFISDREEYCSFIDLETNTSSTIKGLRTLTDKSGISIFPLRISEDGRISMEISYKTENFILSNSNLNIKVDGPAAIFVK